MIISDMSTSFAIGGTASLLALGVMLAVRVEQGKLQYALTLYRMGFLCIATMLAAPFAPPERARLVFQAVLGCVAMGVLLLGWAARQMQGKRTPPWVGWGLTGFTALILWMAAWGLPEQAYVLVLDGIFLSIAVLVLLDHAWRMARGAQLSASEWLFLGLVGLYAVNWSILLAHALTEPGPYPVHWMHAPAWWMPVCTVAYALLPLAVATVVQSIINDGLIRQLRTRALSDELTGALSRRGLRELGERMLMSLRRPQNQMAVLMLDVDHFKKINDTYGHLVGDDVLRHLVNVIQDRLRDDALLARYDGEEFVVLLSIRHPQDACVVAERLRHAVENKPAQTMAGLIKTTLSIGVAYHRPDQTLEQALAVADARLEEAKQAGRNQVVTEELELGGATLSPTPEVVPT